MVREGVRQRDRWREREHERMAKTWSCRCKVYALWWGSWGPLTVMERQRPLPGPCGPRPGQPCCVLEAAARAAEPKVSTTREKAFPRRK